MDLWCLWQLPCLCYVSASSLIYLQMTSWITVRSETWQRRQIISVSIINVVPPPRQPHNIIEKTHSLSHSVQLSGQIYPCTHLLTHLNVFLTSNAVLLRTQQRSLADGGYLWVACRVDFTDSGPEDMCCSMLVLGHLIHVLFSCKFAWIWLTFDFSFKWCLWLHQWI